MKKFITAALLTIALAFPAYAQSLPQNCADRNTIVQRLEELYNEQQITIALGSNNTIVETYASLETGTWTVIVTTAGGPTCLVAAGEAFQLTYDPNYRPNAEDAKRD